MPRPLHLFLELDGAGWHPSAWRRSRHSPADVFSGVRLRELAVTAQAQGFAGVTFEDPAPGDPRNPVGHLDAVQRAAFLAAVTDGIGLVPVVPTTYTEPFHVAAQLASLDHSSHGRAGWVAAVSPGSGPARAVDLPQASAAGLGRELVDGISTARALWDSWEDDAVIRDVATGRYLDRDRVHHVDVRTESYSVKGPSTVPRPPQGHPVVFAAAADLPSDVPAGLVDVVLTGDRDARRTGGGPLVVVDLEIVLDTESASGGNRLAALDVDGVSPTSNRLRHSGSGESLAELLIDLAGTVDGVRLHAAVLDEDVRQLLRSTLPALRAARLLQHPLSGASLRSTLGLARPRNRFAPDAGTPGHLSTAGASA